MSEDSKLNKQLDAVKRQGNEIVDDLRSRKLLAPAIALVVAIVAALVFLPDRSEPEPVASDSAASAAVAAPRSGNAIAISLIGPGSIGDGADFTAGSNPFLGEEGYRCETISKGDPRVLSCEIADLKVRVTCPAESSEPPCGKPVSSEAPESGSTSSTSGGATGPTGGGGRTPFVVYAYQADLQLDGKIYEDVKVGARLPAKDHIVTFTGGDDTGERGTFRAVKGSIVTTIPVDVTGLLFSLGINQYATIEDSTGALHELRLIKLRLKKVKS